MESEKKKNDHIYEAVPLGERTSGAGPSAGEREPHDEEACVLLKQYPSSDLSFDKVIQSCKCHSLILGLIIGCFVQLSSMGAFYLYNSFHDVTLLPSECTKNRVLFSIVWAAFTSGLGVVLMGILALFFRHEGGQLLSKVEESFLHTMECYISTGAVAGVSLAWTIKNIWLGGALDLWQSLALLGVAWVYSRVARCLLLSSVTSDDLAQPLLPDERTTSKPSFRENGLVLGLVVGCLIQLSSLGANYLLNHFFNEKLYHAEEEQLRRNHILFFTMFWSVITSTLGVAVLLLLRRLLKMFWSLSAANNGTDVLSHVELFFAVGAVIGVNLSWYISDSVIGANTWDMKTLFTWLVSCVKN